MVHNIYYESKCAKIGSNFTNFGCLPGEIYGYLWIISALFLSFLIFRCIISMALGNKQRFSI